MKKILSFVFVFYLFYFFPSTLPAVRAVMLSSERIAYVDIERVFSEYKGTKQAKEKIEREIKTRRSEIATLEKEIRELELASKEGRKVEPVAITGLVGEEKIEISTAPVLPEQLPEEVIRLKKERLIELGEKTAQEVPRLDKEITRQILGKIYDVVKEIAQAEGYAIVLDKKNVLYSAMDNDLTEKVIKKLNSGE